MGLSTPSDPVRRGPGVWRTTRTPDGPATVTLVHAGDEIRADSPANRCRTCPCRRPGVARAARRAGTDCLLHPLVVQLARRSPGIRDSRTGAVLELLVPAILEQKVTGHGGLARVGGTHPCPRRPAPGPSEWHLRLAPNAATLAGLRYYAYHPFGIERRRAERIRRVASRAAWFEAIVDLPLADAYARLRALRRTGRGPPPRSASGRWAMWTRSASATSTCQAWSPSRSPASHAETTPGCSSCSSRSPAERALVVRLLELSGVRPARRGPRLLPMLDRGPIGKRTKWPPMSRRGTGAPRRRRQRPSGGVAGWSEAMKCSAPASACARRPAGQIVLQSPG